MVHTVNKKEINFICNYVLIELGKLKPRLSEEITRLVKSSKNKDNSSLEIKYEKIRLLIEKDPNFFEVVMKELNSLEYKGPKSTTNFFSIMEKMLTHLNYKGEITGGNFRDI